MRKYHVLHNPKARKKPVRKTAAKRKATKKRGSRRRKNPELAVPAVGETVEVPLASHPEYTLQVKGKKTPKKYIATLGEDSYYAKIIGPDGEVIGKAKGQTGEFGPYESPADANVAANFLGGILIGADEVLEANPTKRKRLASNARRHFAKPNGGIWDEAKSVIGIGGPQLEAGGKSALAEEDITGAQALVGLPREPKSSYRLGYYFGILRGMDACGYTPSKFLERRRFRKELQNTIIRSVNQLQQAVISPSEAQARIRTTM